MDIPQHIYVRKNDNDNNNDEQHLTEHSVGATIFDRWGSNSTSTSGTTKASSRHTSSPRKPRSSSVQDDANCCNIRSRQRARPRPACRWSTATTVSLTISSNSDAEGGATASNNNNNTIKTISYRSLDVPPSSPRRSNNYCCNSTTAIPSSLGVRKFDVTTPNTLISATSTKSVPNAVRIPNNYKTTTITSLKSSNSTATVVSPVSLQQSIILIDRWNSAAEFDGGSSINSRDSRDAMMISSTSVLGRNSSTIDSAMSIGADSTPRQPSRTIAINYQSLIYKPTWTTGVTTKH